MIDQIIFGSALVMIVVLLIVGILIETGEP